MTSLLILQDGGALLLQSGGGLALNVSEPDSEAITGDVTIAEYVASVGLTETAYGLITAEYAPVLTITELAYGLMLDEYAPELALLEEPA